jgi:hypothetical protein
VTVIARDPSAPPVYTNYDPNSRVELCRHHKSRNIPNDTGYQIVTSRREHGLFGARKRRR